MNFSSGAIYLSFFRLLWILLLWTVVLDLGGTDGNNKNQVVVTVIALSFSPDAVKDYRRCVVRLPPVSRFPLAMLSGGIQQEKSSKDQVPYQTKIHTVNDNNDNIDPTTVEVTKEKKTTDTSHLAKRISMPAPITKQRTWQVWKTISRLEEILSENTNDASSENDNDWDSQSGNGNDASENRTTLFSLYPASQELVKTVLSILTTLANQHEGKTEWQGFLNKSTLLHEVEESILAIHFLQQELVMQSKLQKQQHSNENGIVLVDVCCGKGVFSLLSSYYFVASNSTNNSFSVRKIIMLDKDPKLRWDHIDASNCDTASESSTQLQRPFIECWPRFNLHEIDDVVDRLSKEVDNDETPISLAMVGIHLCKTLSPACIGIANSLGPEKCPNLVLAPCCLPRVVVQSKYCNNDGTSPSTSTSNVLEVRQYETPEQKYQRKLAKQRRSLAMIRGKGSDDNDDGSAIITRHVGACWKCGEFGHVKADCPSNQSTGKPQLIKPPSISLKVSGILTTDRPFGSYCDLLSKSIQRNTITVEETGLTNSHVSTKKQQRKKPSEQQHASNWNRERKSIYIVASEREIISSSN